MAALPTKLVRRKLDGHECVINASDFDPRHHESLEPSPAKSADGDKPVAQAEAKGSKGKR